MGKILGLDYGDVRIGVAISDLTCTIATSKEFIDVRKNDPIMKIKNIIEENDIETVVVGLPLNLKGKYSDKTKEVKNFVKNLRKEISIKIDLWDERFSTVSAEKALRDMNIKAKNQRDKVDSMAAKIILQNYLDSKKY